MTHKDMDRKKKTDPSALKLRVAVIEWREKGEDGWAVSSVWPEGHLCYRESELALACASLSERVRGAEYRYRYATLTFDDDGSKCVIY